MSDVPEGFIVVDKSPAGHSRSGLRAKVTARVTSLSGTPSRELRGQYVEVAINGSRWAIRIKAGDDGYKVNATSGTFNCRDIAKMPGQYTGEKHGDWWIFTPVESAA